MLTRPLYYCFLLFLCAASCTVSYCNAQLTPSDIATVLDAHNQARRAHGLGELVWDSGLAQVAQNFTSQCIYSTNPNRGYAGENVAAGTYVAPPKLFLSMWLGQKDYWNCAQNQCNSGKICGDYTQIVWNATTAVGCGISNCQKGSPFSIPNWTFFVCDYTPPGNVIGERPFSAQNC